MPLVYQTEIFNLCIVKKAYFLDRVAENADKEDLYLICAGKAAVLQTKSQYDTFA